MDILFNFHKINLVLQNFHTHNWQEYFSFSRIFSFLKRLHYWIQNTFTTPIFGMRENFWGTLYFPGTFYSYLGHFNLTWDTLFLPGTFYSYLGHFILAWDTLFLPGTLYSHLGHFFLPGILYSYLGHIILTWDILFLKLGHFILKPGTLYS